MLEENVETYQLWRYCNTQLLTSFGGVIGIDYNAVFKVAEVLCIEVTPAVLAKIRALEDVMVKEVNKDAKTRN